MNTLKLMRKPTIEITEEAVEAARSLIAAASRVDRKYGIHEDGSPKDWTEWQDVRDAVAALKATLPFLSQTG